jgi:VanZ family protein
MARIKFFYYYWLPIFLWAVIIFLFSSFPTGQATYIDWQDFIIKKTAHIVEYGVFTLLIYRSLRKITKKEKNAALYAIFISLLYGLTDEYHQSFTPGRGPKLRDVGFDTIGSILAIYLAWNILPKAPLKLRKLAKNLEII